MNLERLELVLDLVQKVLAFGLKLLELALVLFITLIFAILHGGRD